MKAQRSSKKPVKKTFKERLKSVDWRKIFNQTILIFTIGCIFGTYYEEILTLIKHLFATGELDWVSRRGLVWGPFSPVYGLGAVGIYFVFYLTKAKWPVCLFGGAFLGGGFEFLLSLLQEWIFHTRSWNYSDRFWNIDGRTTVPYALFWGILGVVTACWLYPMLERAYDKLKGRKMDVFCVVLTIFLLFDAGLSIAATLRQSERREGEPADSRLDVFLDEHFSDERLKETYDNATYVSEQTF